MTSSAVLPAPAARRGGASTASDAHSHVLEHDGWLPTYCDADVRERLLPARPASCPAVAGASVPGSGTHDAAARSRALDALGVGRQLVLTTSSVGRFAGAADPDVEHGGALGHNRGIIDFCADDRRLLPVAYLPLRRLPDTLRLLDLALSAGARAVLVPPRTQDGRCTAGPALDPVWARLAEASVPLVLHPPGGVLDQPTEDFLTGLLLGGTFDRTPGLRAAVLGAGARWVPAFARRLDRAALGGPVPPSERVRRHLGVTPSAGEALAPLVAALGPTPWLASADSPGGAVLRPDVDADARQAFLVGNLDRLVGGPA